MFGRYVSPYARALLLSCRFLFSLADLHTSAFLRRILLFEEYSDALRVNSSEFMSVTVEGNLVSRSGALTGGYIDTNHLAVVEYVRLGIRHWQSNGVAQDGVLILLFFFLISAAQKGSHCTGDWRARGASSTAHRGRLRAAAKGEAVGRCHSYRLSYARAHCHALTSPPPFFAYLDNDLQQ